MYSRPREGLAEFIRKCNDRGVYLGLATWFMPHGTQRNLEFKGEDDFVRAWDETLIFLNENNLLSNVIYVDLLNEYPLWHGFEWFKKEMNMRGNEKMFKENNPDANVPDDAFEKRKGNGFTTLQRQFYQNFIDNVITRLKRKWPKLRFFASQTGGAWKFLDHSKCGAIDPHFWFSQNHEFNTNTSVGGLHLFRSPQDSHFKEGYEKVMKYWHENKDNLAAWMENRIKAMAATAKNTVFPPAIPKGGVRFSGRTTR